MCRENPKYILRNYLAQNVIEAAQAGDDQPLAELLEVLRQLYEDQLRRGLCGSPPDWGKGMDISCSS